MDSKCYYFLHQCHGVSIDNPSEYPVRETDKDVINHLVNNGFLQTNLTSSSIEYKLTLRGVLFIKGLSVAHILYYGDTRASSAKLKLPRYALAFKICALVEGFIETLPADFDKYAIDIGDALIIGNYGYALERLQKDISRYYFRQHTTMRMLMTAIADSYPKVFDVRFDVEQLF